MESIGYTGNALFYSVYVFLLKCGLLNISMYVHTSIGQESNGCISLCRDTKEFVGYTRLYDPDCRLADSWTGNDGARGPGPVTNFDVEVTQIPYNGTDRDDLRESNSSVDVLWEPPAKEARWGLEAYAVRRKNRFTNHTSCYIYNLTGGEADSHLQSAQPSRKPMQFRDECEICQRHCGFDQEICEEVGGYYVVHVSSLPDTRYNKLEDQALVTISGPKRSDRTPNLSNDTGCWLTDPVIIINPCRKETQLTFQAVPNRLWNANLKNYRIYYAPVGRLLDPNHNETTILVRNVTFHRVLFGNPEPKQPNYEWMIQIRLEECTSSRCGTGGNMCLQTQSFPFIIPDVPSFGCTQLIPTTGEPPVTNLTQHSTGTDIIFTTQSSENGPSIAPSSIAAIVGSIAGTLVIIILLIVIVRECKSSELSMTKAPKKVKVLILYSKDYPLHEKVVNHFAIFLRDRCCCDVEVDRWNESKILVEQLNWMRSEIKYADKVVIVTSTGTVCKAETYLNRNVRRLSVRETFNSDTFLAGYTHLCDTGLGDPRSETHANVLSVTFDYIPEFHPKLANVRRNYRLLGEMEGFLRDLHGVNKLSNPLAAALLDPHMAHINSSLPAFDFQSEPKVKLTNAISEMTTLVRRYPKWFEDYHEFRDYDINTDSYTSYREDRERVDSITTGESISQDSQTALLPDVRAKTSSKATNGSNTRPNGGHQRSVSADSSQAPMPGARSRSHAPQVPEPYVIETHAAPPVTATGDFYHQQGARITADPNQIVVTERPAMSDAVSDYSDFDRNFNKEYDTDLGIGGSSCLSEQKETVPTTVTDFTIRGSRISVI